MKILLVEDDVKVANFIKRGLSENNFMVDHAIDGEEGKRLLSDHEYDLVILDLLIPKISGFELCRLIREEDTKIPILMLTALGTTDDKVIGLNAGADDYIVKPFEFRELVARVNALTRRSLDLVSGTVLQLADLEMSLEEKVVRRGAKEIQLTAREFNFLLYLFRNKGKVLSRSDIEERIWGTTFERNSNVVDVYVNFLRKKIDKDFQPKLIHTVIGMGYVLKIKDQ